MLFKEVQNLDILSHESLDILKTRENEVALSPTFAVITNPAAVYQWRIGYFEKFCTKWEFKYPKSDKHNSALLLPLA